MTWTPYVPSVAQGLGMSVHGMITPMQQFQTVATNMANYGTPGYQRVQTFQTALCEVAGPYALRTSVDQSHGRLRRTGYPLDVAMNSDGYLHRVTGDGFIEPTRDGRMRLDKDGFVVSVDNKKILSATGKPIQLPYFPEELDKQVRITANGELLLYDGKTGERDFVTRLGLFDKDGQLYSNPDVKQHYVEDANVVINMEAPQMLPLRRAFEANRQLFIMQNDTLSRAIQELGRPA
jgi:flagellar basal-body rod protein FlgF